MPSQITQHNIYLRSDYGMQIRRISPSAPQATDSPVPYLHQDDYYIIGLLQKGKGRAIIDFKENAFSAGEIFVIQPGQAHRFISAEQAEGWLLFADGSFVGSAEKCIFDKIQQFASSLKLDGQRRIELEQIASLLLQRTRSITNEQAKITARRLTEAFIGIVAEAVQDISLQQAKHSQRHIEIIVSFRHLLDKHLATSHSPSYYASLLNISPVYLNQIVKEVTGTNTTLYIRKEITTQAKRLLVHTNLSIKEIALRVGIGDYSYFSRLFTQSAGITPSAFRQRNIE